MCICSRFTAELKEKAGRNDVNTLETTYHNQRSQVVADSIVEPSNPAALQPSNTSPSPTF